MPKHPLDGTPLLGPGIHAGLLVRAVRRRRRGGRGEEGGGGRPPPPHPTPQARQSADSTAVKESRVGRLPRVPSTKIEKMKGARTEVFARRAARHRSSLCLSVPRIDQSTFVLPVHVLFLRCPTSSYIPLSPPRSQSHPPQTKRRAVHDGDGATRGCAALCLFLCGEERRSGSAVRDSSVFFSFLTFIDPFPTAANGSWWTHSTYPVIKRAGGGGEWVVYLHCRLVT